MQCKPYFFQLYCAPLIYIKKMADEESVIKSVEDLEIETTPREADNDKLNIVADGEKNCQTEEKDIAGNSDTVSPPEECGVDKQCDEKIENDIKTENTVPVDDEDKADVESSSQELTNVPLSTTETVSEDVPEKDESEPVEEAGKADNEAVEEETPLSDNTTPNEDKVKTEDAAANLSDTSLSNQAKESEGAAAILPCVNFSGDWKSDRQENFEEFLKAAGMWKK